MTTYNYDVRFTRNMGNYESLQISEGLADEAVGDEELEALRERVKAKVESWIFADIEDVEREIRGLRARLDEEEAGS
jgi:hypothetical protein